MACGITFLSENLVNSSNISITTGTVNSQFPLSNIKNDSTVKMFRSVENNCVLVFDLQQTREIDAIAIAGNAVTTLGITDASIKTSLTTDFSSATVIPLVLSAEYAFGYTPITEVEHRYVELTLTGNGSFCELSNIFIGKAINITTNSLSIGSFRYEYIDNSDISSNDYGMEFINELNVMKSLSGSIEYCDKTEQEIVDNIWLYHGRRKPLWVILDDENNSMNDGKYKLSAYCRFNKKASWAASGGRHYSIDLDFNQVI
jgi:hypothetical protein